METVAVSLRNLPSIDRLLQSQSASLMEKLFGRNLTTRALREVLAEARIRAADGADVPGDVELLESARVRLNAWLSPTLRPVINATGVIIHTNLGRAPLSSAAQDAIQSAGQSYSTLEYDLAPEPKRRWWSTTTRLPCCWC
jgi:L-seryl-tRNA(Ser) seleniumtransferase